MNQKFASNMRKSNIWKTVLKVVVLSEGTFEWETLGDVHYAISEDPCIGRVYEKAAFKLNPKDVEDELEFIGNDGSFFDELDGDEEDSNE